MTPLRLAHRGDWRAAPENTLAAMTAALALPACDGFEFDVRTSRDGVPVLLHDSSLRRVQRVSMAVADLDAGELATHGIPTLAEVLAAVGPIPSLDVELKVDELPAIVGVLEAARGPGLERAVVSSFDSQVLASLGRRKPHWPRWLNALDLAPATIGLAVDAGCDGVAALWTGIDAIGIERARRAGLEVAAWTVRNRLTYERLEGLGVVAVCVE